MYGKIKTILYSVFMYFGACQFDYLVEYAHRHMPILLLTKYAFWQTPIWVFS